MKFNILNIIICKFITNINNINNTDDNNNNLYYFYCFIQLPQYNSADMPYNKNVIRVLTK